MINPNDLPATRVLVLLETTLFAGIAYAAHHADLALYMLLYGLVQIAAYFATNAIYRALIWIEERRQGMCHECKQQRITHEHGT